LVFFNPCHRSIDAAPGGAGGRGLEIMKAATSQACCSESSVIFADSKGFAVIR
jgi:hypothetical protein